MVLGGQSREVIMLTDDNDHLPQPAASGQEQSLEVGFQFELPKPILSSFNDRLSASKNNYRNLWGH